MKRLSPIFLALLLMGCTVQYSSDQEMIRNLEEHRSDFEKLVEIIQSHPRLYRVDNDWTRPSDTTIIGVSPERLSEIRDLCEECGLSRGFYSFANGSNINFIAEAGGLSISGSGKGYQYMVVPRAIKRVLSTDDYIHPKNEPFTVYRHIEGPWFIWYDVR